MSIKVSSEFFDDLKKDLLKTYQKGSVIEIPISFDTKGHYSLGFSVTGHASMSNSNLNLGSEKELSPVEKATQSMHACMTWLKDAAIACMEADMTSEAEALLQTYNVL